MLQFAGLLLSLELVFLLTYIKLDNNVSCLTQLSFEVGIIVGKVNSKVNEAAE